MKHRGFKFFFLSIILFSTSFAFAYPKIPNEDMTPGELCITSDKDYSHLRYKEKIPYCRRNVNTSLKRYIYESYDIPEKCRDRYTIDHFIPLSIGGNNSPENLWPEHVLVKATRPQLEQDVFFALRDSKITQKEALEIIINEKTASRKRVRKGVDSSCDQPTY